MVIIGAGPAGLTAAWRLAEHGRPPLVLERGDNFNNWSRHMVPEPGKTCLGLEYFCDEDDSLWRRSDDELLERRTV